MKIPKIIHWCWVGQDEPPLFIRNCLNTWKKVMPDYEIRCWDAESLKEIDNVFVREAYSAKAWAFVADYVRLYALSKFGGIYLDSDVEVYKSFDGFLDNSFFTGHDIDTSNKVAGPQAAIMGSIPNHPFINEFLKYYDNRHFLMADGQKDIVVMPIVMGAVLEKHGYEYKDTNQDLAFDSKIYSTAYFCDGNSVRYRKRNYAFHVNSNYWCYSERGPIAKFCWKHRLLPLYLAIEKLRLRIIRKLKNI
jgi:hypothetical protein